MKTFIVLFFCLASTLSAQTISPLLSEFGKKASGSFIVRNNGIRPMMVSLEKRGFLISAKGEATLIPLPAGIEIQVGATSATVPPKGTHTFYYKMTCAQLPCHAQILALFSAGERTADGMKLAFGLPTVIYVCEKKKNCRLNTLRSYGYDPTLQAKK